MVVIMPPRFIIQVLAGEPELVVVSSGQDIGFAERQVIRVPDDGAGVIHHLGRGAQVVVDEVKDRPGELGLRKTGQDAGQAADAGQEDRILGVFFHLRRLGRLSMEYLTGCGGAGQGQEIQGHVHLVFLMGDEGYGIGPVLAAAPSARNR